MFTAMVMGNNGYKKYHMKGKDLGNKVFFDGEFTDCVALVGVVASIAIVCVQFYFAFTLK